VLTLAELVEDMGLVLLAGGEAAASPIRWVHATELADPTPWLSGGELVLTTGMQLKDAAAQKEFITRLSRHQAAGVGFGTGFDHEHVPGSLLRTARALGFPIFEVPYELPFIAITERAFTALVSSHYEVLRRSIAVHRRLERLLLEERGLDAVVAAIAATIAGAVVVLDRQGETIASALFHREFPEQSLGGVREEIRLRARDTAGTDAFAPSDPDLSGRALVLPVVTPGRAPQAWLVAARDDGGFDDLQQIVLEQAVTVIALELLRERVSDDAERRLAGDVLAETVSGELSDRDIETRLRPFGIGTQAAVLVFDVAEPHGAERRLTRALAERGPGALVASLEGLVCAVVDGLELDPLALATELRAVLEEPAGRVRAAASRSAPTTLLRRSFHEARWALEAVAMTPNGDSGANAVASYRDLGSFQLLLSLQDDEALRLFCEGVLGPIATSVNGYGDELLHSLEVFLEHNGNWERAARALYCHRHTLRYRMRRVEELTDRDLGSARDRIEFWLALRGRELVR
jgi:purine catabolism regulator